jgi:hypothetical protein
VRSIQHARGTARLCHRAFVHGPPILQRTACQLTYGEVSRYPHDRPHQLSPLFQFIFIFPWLERGYAGISHVIHGIG